jgi:type IV pilus assembly protein PilE
MKRHSGITLVELLVVVTIIGIIAAVAVPSYRNQTLRANRTEAKTVLQQATQVLEKCFTRTRSYATCAAQVATGNTPGRLYNIRLETTATTYTVSADAINGQTADTSCGTLSINQMGARTPAAPDPNRCW